MEYLEKYIISLISIVSCCLGYWMGRRTRKTHDEIVAEKPTWSHIIKKTPQDEPEGDVFSDALGSPDQDVGRVPTIINRG